MRNSKAGKPVGAVIEKIVKTGELAAGLLVAVTAATQIEVICLLLTVKLSR
jgi:hypothetical protein